MLSRGLWEVKRKIKIFSNEYIQDAILTKYECLEIIKQNNKCDLLNLYCFDNCLLTRKDFKILFNI